MTKTAIYFEVRFSDGTGMRAEGDAAQKIMEWYGSGEAMNCIHGGGYDGPQPENFKWAEPRGSSGAGNEI